MRRDTCQRVQRHCGRPWQLGPQSCRGIWPGGSANSPPATTRTPPGSETATEWVGIQDQVTKLFNIIVPEMLRIGKTDASTEQM